MASLYFDLNMGVAGDMLAASLIGLFDNEEEIINELNNLKIPHIKYVLEKKKVNGIIGNHLNVVTDYGVEGEHNHHEHHHLDDIYTIIDSINTSDKIKNNLKDIYKLIASAESKVHNEDVEHIHFHEVGSLDAIADICAVCYLIDKIKPDAIYASPINTGSGVVKCAHGILPVPAPATEELLIGIPTFARYVESELTTPTGAALCKYFVERYCDRPNSKIVKVGYGLGTKEFDVLNAVKVFLIEETKKLNILSCAIDDMTSEDISYACEKLMENGANDVYYYPIYMKKGRIGTCIEVLCGYKDNDKFTSLIFKHTTTLGIKRIDVDRYTLDRTIEEVNTPVGLIRKKVSSGYDTLTTKYEYEDLIKIADRNNISLKELRSKL